MHILLTRPLEDSKDLIMRFKELGHQVSHLPVITIEKKDYEDPNYNEFKGIIFTSSNAIKNLDISKINKDIFCFCVGNATEKIAKEKGFQNIFTAEGNVSNLKEIILQNFDPKNGNLIYVSGELVSYDLDKELKNGMPKEVVDDARISFQKRLDQIKWDDYYKSWPFNESALALYNWAPVANELKSLDRKIVLNSMILKWDNIKEEFSKLIKI